VFGGQHYDEILIPLGGLYKKRAGQRGFWATAHHLFYDRGKSQKTWFWLVGRRTFRMRTEL